MQFERWVKLNVDKGRAATVDLGMLYTQDVNPLKLGVRLEDSEGEIDASGTVSGTAIIPDGSTITLEGDKEGNAAWVIVPQEVLAYQGRVEIFLRIADAEAGAVALYATGTVKRAQTDSVIVPGDPLPGVDEIREIISEAAALLDADIFTASVSGTTLVLASV